MATTLVYHETDSTTVFEVPSHPSHSPEEWGTLQFDRNSRGSTSVDTLLSLLQSGNAKIENHSIIVENPVLASLERSDLQRLGLPDIVPFQLLIGSGGAITDPSFTFSPKWVRRDGRPVGLTSRTGAFLNAGGAKFFLAEPFYTLVVEMERFNSFTPDSREDRFLLWSRLKDLLPDGATADGYLREMQIARADAFTLRGTADHGQFSFEPVPIMRNYDPSDDFLRNGKKEDRPCFDEGDKGKECFPTAVGKDFCDQFRKFSSVHSSYALRNGYYIVIPPDVKRCLEVVHKKQRTVENDRRQFFLEAPRQLKEILSYEENEGLVNERFVETDAYVEEVRLYSKRVIGVDEYKKPEVLFYSSSKQPWLPPEEILIRSVSGNARFPTSELDAVIDAMEAARARGESKINVNGQEVEVTPEIVADLRRSKARIDDAGNATHSTISSSDSSEDSGIRLTVQIERNLEVVNFKQVTVEREIAHSSELVAMNTAPLPHQVVGIGWLQDHWNKGSRGALLADDMGLGKTFQVLAMLAWLQIEFSRQNTGAPFLVVAPTGLLKNWEAEHDRHLGGHGLGAVCRAYGKSLSKLRRREGASNELRLGTSILDVTAFNQSPWTLTTYETLRDYQHSFSQIPWEVVVFDEAQKIKNPTSLMTDAAKALNAKFTLALTGTPVENQLADLWCILDTVQPGCLNSLSEFTKEFVREDIENSQVQLGRLSELLSVPQGRLPQIMLRRMKADHLDGLPNKFEQIHDQLMPPIQSNAYTKAIEKARGLRGDRKSILKALQEIRAVSLFPNDVDQGVSDGEWIQSSARLIKTFQILDGIRKNQEKALVFVDSLSMLSAMSGVIQRRYDLKQRPMIISGDVSGEKRLGHVDKFEEERGFGVLLMSPRAAGVGLTIVSANHVLHVSRWWNPAVEDQCTDRAYRIGQRRDVYVYYIRAIHPDFKEQCFDVRLHELLDTKRRLSREALAPVESSMEEIKNLFGSVIA